MIFNVSFVADYPRSLPPLSLSNTHQFVQTHKKIDGQQIQQRQYKINVARAIDIIISLKQQKTPRQPYSGSTNTNSNRLPGQSIRCVSCVGCILHKVG